MKIKTLVWIIIAIGLVIGVVWYALAQQQSPATQPPLEVTDASAIKGQYPKLPTDNRFVIAEPSQIIALLDGGSGVVFLGFPECPWCQQLAPIVDEAAKAEDLERIYYLDIRQARQNNDDIYQRLVKKLEKYLPKDDDGNPRIFVPDVTVFHQGEVVGRFEREPVADGEQAMPDTFWTDDRRSRAVDQLQGMIRQMQQLEAS